MSLAKQSVNLGLLFVATSSTNTNRVEYTVTVQNKNIEVVPEFFSGGAFDESIGGKRISNLRGYRVRITLTYNASMESTTKTVGTGSGTSSTFREMFNEIMSCFSTGQIKESLSLQTFGALYVRIDQAVGNPVAIETFDGSGVFMKFVPEDVSYTQSYTNQIGRFIPSITLVSETLMPSIPEELQGVL